jgi:hypothetical protein
VGVICVKVMSGVREENSCIRDVSSDKVTCNRRIIPQSSSHRKSAQLSQEYNTSSSPDRQGLFPT